jgi:serine/threonine protein phosphatase PrpC
MSEQAPANHPEAFSPDVAQLLADNTAAHAELKRKAAEDEAARVAAHKASLQEGWLGDQSTEGKTHKQLANQAKTVKSWAKYAEGGVSNDAEADQAREAHFDAAGESKSWDKMTVKELVGKYEDALSFEHVTTDGKVIEGDPTLEADVIAEFNRRITARTDKQGSEESKKFVQAYERHLAAARKRVARKKAAGETGDDTTTDEKPQKAAAVKTARKAVDVAHEEPATTESNATSAATSEATASVEKEPFITVASLSEAAEYRSNPEDNEDAILVDEENRIFGVFDGVGGSTVDGGQAGNASATAARVIREELAKFENGTVDEEGDIAHAFDLASEALAKLGETGETTASVVRLIEAYGKRYAVIGNIGDSRILMNPIGSRKYIHDGTVDNSGMRRGDVKYEVVADTSIGNVIYGAIGANGVPKEGRGQVETNVIRIDEDTRIILCSDGITGDRADQFLTIEEMDAVFAAPTADEAAQWLREYSLKIDDKSVVVIDVKAAVESTPVIEEPETAAVTDEKYDPAQAFAALSLKDRIAAFDAATGQAEADTATTVIDPREFDTEVDPPRATRTARQRLADLAADSARVAAGEPLSTATSDELIDTTTTEEDDDETSEPQAKAVQPPKPEAKSAKGKNGLKNRAKKLLGRKKATDNKEAKAPAKLSAKEQKEKQDKEDQARALSIARRGAKDEAWMQPWHPDNWDGTKFHAVTPIDLPKADPKIRAAAQARVEGKNATAARLGATELSRTAAKNVVATSKFIGRTLVPSDETLRSRAEARRLEAQARFESGESYDEAVNAATRTSQSQSSEVARSAATAASAAAKSAGKAVGRKLVPSRETLLARAESRRLDAEARANSNEASPVDEAQSATRKRAELGKKALRKAGLYLGVIEETGTPTQQPETEVPARTDIAPIPFMEEQLRTNEERELERRRSGARS